MPRIITEEWIERERALIQFRNGSVSYLITTDLSHVDWYTREPCDSLSFTFKEDEFTPRKRTYSAYDCIRYCHMLLMKARKNGASLDAKMPVLQFDNDNIA
jgi:superfamily II DNA/RNA helicase